MLQSIKGSIASPWLRYSLFGVLILSFGVWGIGDVLRRLVSPSAELLAEGDGIAIDRQSFAQYWQRATVAFRAQGLTSQQLLAGPLPRLVFDRMLGQALLHRAVEDLRLEVPPSVLKKTIAEEPLFAGEDGRFASWRFVSFLRQTGLSEQAYLQELQANLLQSNLLESLSFQISLPEPFLRELLAARQEQRELQILNLPLPPLKAIADPGDESLMSFMQKEQALFRLPEYRQFAYATLAHAPEGSLDETLVRDYYEERKGELRDEEKRSFLQLFFVEEEDARRAEAALESGKKVDEVTASFSIDPLRIEEQARKDLLDETLANSVFAMAQKGDLAVVKGGLGWYLLRLENIVPMRVPNFKSVRSALTKQLLQERSAQRYAEAVSQAEDMLFAGASLAEVAETLNLTIATTPLVDVEKFLTSGVKAQRLWRNVSEEEERELLTLGFDLSAEGEASQAFEIEGKNGRTEALFVELRKRKESQLADLTQKRAAVLAVYRDLTRREQQHARAKKLAEAVQQEGLTQVARREGLSLSHRTVVRNAQERTQEWDQERDQEWDQEWDADFLASLFVAREGDVLTTRGKGGDLVVRLASVRRPAVLSFTASEVKKFAENLAAESALPLSSYRQALQKRVNLRLDEEAFAEFVATGLSP